MSMKPISDWRDHGVKVIPGSQLDLNTPQTPNMTRAAAITSESVEPPEEVYWVDPSHPHP
jgi:uncharacterized RmlC-like cupin family protein